MKFLLSVLIAIGLFIIVYQKRISHRATSVQTLENQALPSPSPEIKSSNSATSSHSPFVSPLSVTERQGRLDSFEKKQGSSFKSDFSSDGFLVSMVRERDPNIGKSRFKFDSSDLSEVRDRANKTIQELGEVLGLESDLPLSEAQIKGDEYSAHVVYQETWQGFPLAPFGFLAIDLGPHGELLGLYSSYVRNLSVTNQKKIDGEKAKNLAQTALRSILRNEKLFSPIEGGRVLIWVFSTSSSQALGRYAYEFYSHGHQVIVDAETGKILYQRDRRQF